MSTGRKCDGYSQPVQANAAAVLVIRGDDFAVCGHYESRTAFRYFLDTTAPALVNFGSHYFWNILVFQVSHEDECIKHLVIAASTLDRRQRSTIEPQQGLTAHRYHYSKALHSLSSRSNPDTGVVLMACLLFMICDEFQENHCSALQHIMAGRNILGDYCNQRNSAQYSPIVEELGPIFQRLQLHTGELDQETMPYHIRWPFLNQRRAQPVKPDTPKPIFDFQPPSLFQGYQDVSIAGSCLQALAYSCFKPQLGTRPPTSRFHVVPNITTQLNQWRLYFDGLCIRLDAKQATAQRTQIHLFRLYHSCLSIISRCAPFDNETLYDHLWGQLEHVMVKASVLLHTNDVERLEEKLLPALFFIAAHYRDVAMRRRAICSLGTCGWEGIRLATIAEQMVELEERECDNAIVAADIPESNRVRAIEVIFSSKDEQNNDLGTSCTLIYCVHPYGQPSSLKRHTFEWEGIGDQAVQESVSLLLGRALNFEFLSIAT